MKTPRGSVRRGGTSWHKWLVPLLLSAALGCGENVFGSSGTACCEAACVSGIGDFRFMSDAQPVTVTGHATITEIGSGAVLLDSDVQGGTLVGAPDERALEPFEGTTITVEVAVNAVGYAPFVGTFSMSVERHAICCSSCLSANGAGDIVLEPAVVRGCDGVGNTIDVGLCPTTPPSEPGACPGLFTCCIYDTGAAMLPCSCADDGWHCGEAMCSCPQT